MLTTTASDTIIPVVHKTEKVKNNPSIIIKSHAHLPTQNKNLQSFKMISKTVRGAI